MTDPADMTPEQVRVEIAEWCGWRNMGLNHNSALCGFHPKYGADGVNHYVPNYPEDLNAMWEAEERLTDQKQWYTYKNYLWQALIGFARTPAYNRQELYGDDICHLGALQRAIAFVRVIRG